MKKYILVSLVGFTLTANAMNSQPPAELIQKQQEILNTIYSCFPEQIQEIVRTYDKHKLLKCEAYRRALILLSPCLRSYLYEDAHIRAPHIAQTVSKIFLETVQHQYALLGLIDNTDNIQQQNNLLSRQNKFIKTRQLVGSNQPIKVTNLASARLKALQLLSPQQLSKFHHDGYAQDKQLSFAAIYHWAILVADELVEIKQLIPDDRISFAEKIAKETIIEFDIMYNIPIEEISSVKINSIKETE